MNLASYLPYDRITYFDPFEKIRISQVLMHSDGNILDVGCGFNNLARNYRGNNPNSLSIGIDSHNWHNMPDVIADARYLPIRNETFDSISFVASLNHIPYREKALDEARRVLKKDGKIYVTMISEIVGRIIHMLFDKDEKERGFKEGEILGMPRDKIISLFERTNFKLTKESKFELGLNKLYTFKK